MFHFHIMGITRFSNSRMLLHVVAHGGAYPAGGGYAYEQDDDFRGAANHAANHAEEDESFFSSILNSLSAKKQQVAQEDIDEDG